MSLLWNDDLSFLYSGIGICEKTGSFYLQKNEGGRQSEQRKKSEI